MSVILFREKTYMPKLPILTLCYSTTTFYRLASTYGFFTSASKAENEKRKNNFFWIFEFSG